MTDSYVPVEELAKYLCVKVPTVREWVAKGYIPKHTFIKVANTYRFSIPQVVAALKEEVPEPTYDNQNEPVQLELDFSDEEDV
jgi:excisionase family DNA binding protein